MIAGTINVWGSKIFKHLMALHREEYNKESISMEFL